MAALSVAVGVQTAPADVPACLTTASSSRVIDGPVRRVRVEVGPDQAIDARGARVEIRAAGLTPALTCL